jgi:hypothetical protein
MFRECRFWEDWADCLLRADEPFCFKAARLTYLTYARKETVVKGAIASSMPKGEEWSGAFLRLFAGDAALLAATQFFR